MADQKDVNFIEDSELLPFIDQSWAELYDIMIKTFEDYYLTSSPATVATNASSIPLPSDFYKLRGLDYDNGSGDYTDVERYNFNERNRKNLASYRNDWSDSPVRYRLQGNTIKLTPTDQAAGNYQVWYYPVRTPLVNDSDVIDVISGFEEYIVIDASIKIKQSAEEDIRPLQLAKDDMRKRLEAMSANRDAAKPQTITRSRSISSRNGWRW